MSAIYAEFGLVTKNNQVRTKIYAWEYELPESEKNLTFILLSLQEDFKC